MRLALVVLLPLFLVACSEDDLAPFQPEVSDPEVAEPFIANPDVQQPEVRAPDHWTDVFFQRDAKVDVLWVIDVSESMADERDQLASNFDHFMTSLGDSGARYQIGVTTTDLSATGDGGTLVGPTPVITPQTPDPKAAFAENLAVTPRTAAEQPLESARQVLTTPAGDSLLRPGAALAVIILTDEDDSSIGDPSFYERTFLGAKGAGNQNLVTVSAIAGDVPGGCVTPGYEDVLGAGANAATSIHQVVTGTGGAFGSICAQDFGPALDSIGWRVAGLARIFPLSRAPVTGTIHVEVDGDFVPEQTPAPAGWQYRSDVNSLAFTGDYIPEANAEIRVRYAVQ